MIQSRVLLLILAVLMIMSAIGLSPGVEGQPAFVAACRYDMTVIVRWMKTFWDVYGYNVVSSLSSTH